MDAIRREFSEYRKHVSLLERDTPKVSFVLMRPEPPPYEDVPTELPVAQQSNAQISVQPEWKPSTDPSVVPSSSSSSSSSSSHPVMNVTTNDDSIALTVKEQPKRDESSILPRTDISDSILVNSAAKEEDRIALTVNPNANVSREPMQTMNELSVATPAKAVNSTISSTPSSSPDAVLTVKNRNGDNGESFQSVPRSVLKVTTHNVQITAKNITIAKSKPTSAVLAVTPAPPVVTKPVAAKPAEPPMWLQVMQQMPAKKKPRPSAASNVSAPNPNSATPSSKAKSPSAKSAIRSDAAASNQSAQQQREPELLLFPDNPPNDDAEFLSVMQTVQLQEPILKSVLQRWNDEEALEDGSMVPERDVDDDNLNVSVTEIPSVLLQDGPKREVLAFLRDNPLSLDFGPSELPKKAAPPSVALPPVPSEKRASQTASPAVLRALQVIEERKRAAAEAEARRAQNKQAAALAEAKAASAIPTPNDASPAASAAPQVEENRPPSSIPATPREASPAPEVPQSALLPKQLLLKPDVSEFGAQTEYDTVEYVSYPRSKQQLESMTDFSSQQEPQRIAMATQTKRDEPERQVIYESFTQTLAEGQAASEHALPRIPLERMLEPNAVEVSKPVEEPTASKAPSKDLSIFNEKPAPETDVVSEIVNSIQAYLTQHALLYALSNHGENASDKKTTEFYTDTVSQLAVSLVQEYMSRHPAEREQVSVTYGDYDYSIEDFVTEHINRDMMQLVAELLLQDFSFAKEDAVQPPPVEAAPVTPPPVEQPSPPVAPVPGALAESKGKPKPRRTSAFLLNDASLALRATADVVQSVSPVVESPAVPPPSNKVTLVFAQDELTVSGRKRQRKQDVVLPAEPVAKEDMLLEPVTDAFLSPPVAFVEEAVQTAEEDAVGAFEEEPSEDSVPTHETIASDSHDLSADSEGALELSYGEIPEEVALGLRAGDILLNPSFVELDLEYGRVSEGEWNPSLAFGNHPEQVYVFNSPRSSTSSFGEVPRPS